MPHAVLPSDQAVRRGIGVFLLLLACGVAPDAGAGYLRSGSLTWRPSPWTPRAIGAAHRQFARSSRRPTWRRRPGSSPRHETGVASRMVGAERAGRAGAGIRQARELVVRDSRAGVAELADARDLKVRCGLGFSENGSRHHLNNGAGPPAPPRTRSQERGGRCRRPYRSPPPLSKGPPAPFLQRSPAPRMLRKLKPSSLSGRGGMADAADLRKT